MILFKNCKGLEKTKILITNFSMGDGNGAMGVITSTFLIRSLWMWFIDLWKSTGINICFQVIKVVFERDLKGKS